MHKSSNQEKEELVFEPLTTTNWDLFEALMGVRGGCGGCWCMSFRLSRQDFSKNKYDGNKAMMQDLVCAGEPAGLIAMFGRESIGWIAFAPRSAYKRIESSRAFQRRDNQPVWSITCLFLKKEWRRKGLSEKMIKGVIDFARREKIETIEAYPAIPYSDKVPSAFLWVGILSAFEKNGFEVVQRNGKSRALVRLAIV